MPARPTQQPRTRCRLPCTVTKGTRRVRARVLDVSEGGLCIVAPVRFQNKMTINVTIDDPRQGPVQVEAVVWHERPFKQPSSGRRGYATGLVLSKGGADFQALANPGAAVAKPMVTPAQGPHAALCADEPELDAGGPSVFRVRLKAVGSPRMRTLTLSAISEAAVREAVLTDLQGDWQVLDVEADPID